MGAHVFVVDETSFPVHRDRRFCGVKNPRSPKVIYGLLADLKGVRIGDTVIFYKRRIKESPEERGFYGIFKVVSDPFFDTTNINGVGESAGKSVLGKCPHCSSSYSEKTDENGNLKCVNCKKTLTSHILPNRVIIEPVKYFDKPIDDNTAYIDRTDMKDVHKDILWTMLFRKVFGPGRERSISHILPEEVEKLFRLFNRMSPTDLPPSEPYPKSSNMKPITIKLQTHSDGSLIYENMLEAWMMENIDKNIPVLKDIVGPVKDLEYFGNGVLYGIGGEKVDFLCLNKDSSGERYRAVVIELKRGAVDNDAVLQVKRYTKWMAQLVTNNDENKIQPVIIGHKVSQSIIHLAKTVKVPNKIILVEYKVDGNKINFEIVN